MSTNEGTTKFRIVIVEDEFLVGLDLENILRQLGHEVVDLVATEPEAMAVIEAERPDLVITDISLGRGGDGLSVSRQARERFGTRAIVITGSTDGVTYLRAEDTEPLAFIRKPFGLAQIRNVFQQLEHAKAA